MVAVGSRGVLGIGVDRGGSKAVRAKGAMFTGLHHCLMDDKGRLAFPAPFRATLERAGAGDRFVVTQSFFEPCLIAITEPQLAALAEKASALPSSSAAAVQFKRFVLAPAVTVTIDKAGRVSVPKELREYAGLERECTWAGVVEKIELWSKPRWDDLNAKRLENVTELAKMREILESHGL
jgi:MraZ protein